MIKNLLVIVGLLLTFQTTSQNLAHYKLTIASADLDAMYATPKEEEYFPAVFEANGKTYNVEARFKGSTSLNYPKKSWAIKFENATNDFGARRINLHGDYKDHSAMRNFLILKLFNHFGLASPTVKHVTYEVNGQPYGVFTQVEQIDKDFIRRNGREDIALYKATNHGALMAPAVRDDYYRLIWQIEEGGDASYDELRVFFNKMLYLSKADFDQTIHTLIDTDNFLTFFAIHFVFVDLDNFTKNIFLNKNSNTHKFELFPWDNEGSFGNTAIGEFTPTKTEYNMRDAFTPEYQVVLQRLLENTSYKAKFQTEISRVLNEGYAYLDTLIDNTYQRIKDPVYADPKKESTNAQFDNSIPQIKWFMANRKVFLQNNPLPARHPLYDLEVLNPYPTNANPIMTFRIKSPVVQPVNMFFADSVNFNRFGQPFKFSRLQLYDDGQHNDIAAADLLYANNINTNNFVSNLIPFTFTGAEQNFPPNGIFYIDYYGSKSYAINKGNADPNIAQRLRIGNVFRFGRRQFVEIENTSNALPVDISYFHLRTSNAHEDFMFRDNIVLAPGEKIIVSPNPEIGNYFFPNHRTVGSLYFEINEGAQLQLLNSLLMPVIAKQVNTINTLEANDYRVVFNEINFKSGTLKPADDWVEIFNPGTVAVDMSGWLYTDSNNKNKYFFENGFTLAPNSYVVVAQNLSKFKAAYPEVENVVGNADFGLTSDGEYIRLYNKSGVLVDSVYYRNEFPWPVGASGTGHTLELSDAALDNNIGENWFVDDKKFGSPGARNFLTTNVFELNELRFAVYPNPAVDHIFIKNEQQQMYYEIVSMQGTTFVSGTVEGFNTQRIDLSNVAKGVYLLKTRSGTLSKTTKIVIR